MKLNGKLLTTSTDYDLSADGFELTLKAQNMDAAKEQTLELVGIEDTATTANVTDYVKQTFKPTVDTVSPKVKSVTTKSDTTLVVEFSKPVALNGLDADDYIKLIDEDLTDVSSTLISSATFEAVAGSNNTKFEVVLDASAFTGTAKTAKYTVQFLDKKVTDLQGNEMAKTSNDVTFTKDAVAPKLTSTNFRKDNDGKVKELIFTFDEDVAIGSGITLSNLTTILSNTSVNNANAVSDALTAAIPNTTVTSSAVVVDGNKVIVPITAQALSGKYTFELKAGAFEDLSETVNAVKATQFTLDFGTDTAVQTFKVDNSVANKPVGTKATRSITVTFEEAVKGGDVEGSATRLSAYTLNGAALPTGTVITLDSAQKVATIVLPTASITKTDAAGVLTVNNVKNKAGNKSLEKFVGTVDIFDNVKPELKSAQLTADNNLLVTFSEAVTPNIADLAVYINGTTVSGLAITPGTGSDVGKYIVDLSSIVIYDSTDTGLDLNDDGTIDVVITAGSDTTSTFDFKKASAVKSIKLVVEAAATVDGEGNTLVTNTEFKIK